MKIRDNENSSFVDLVFPRFFGRLFLQFTLKL